MRLDRAAAPTWLYPGHLPARPYQVAITRTALLHNTLVCLPTGLGKTVIGAAVLANFLRWFPGGKCVFTAPTRPLVAQQAAACMAAMGPAVLPPACVREMIGSGGGGGGGGGGAGAGAGAGLTTPAARAAAWADPATRVVFTTPAAFKNDVVLGACPFESVVCVVVDECHRAVGKADGAVALRRMREGGASFRTVGLSATPGRSPTAVQAVVDTLASARIEHRGCEDGDVAPYVHPVVSEVVVVSPAAAAARAAGVAIVSGDTKVVERGKADRVFINTAGVGVAVPGVAPSGDRARPGDAILVSGTMGDHGVAIMSSRENLTFETTIQSDSAALHELVAAMVAAAPDIHCLRDPTRGGLATTLNEIAHQSGVGMMLREADIPIRPQVAAACELLGLDPLYVANEGKLVAIVAPEAAETVLAAMRAHPLGLDSALIGTVQADSHHFVQMQTGFGGRRIVDWLSGEQLPRIC